MSTLVHQYSPIASSSLIVQARTTRCLLIYRKVVCFLVCPVVNVQSYVLQVEFQYRHWGFS